MEGAELLHKMAMSDYYMVELPESRNPNEKWGQQYVGLNDYKAYVPRETPVLLSEPLLKMLEQTRQASNPNDRRDDTVFIQRRGPFTPQQAHEKRRSGDMPVFPQRLPEAIVAELMELAK